MTARPFAPHKPPTEQLPPRRIRAVRVKNVLFDIQTNRANFNHGRLLL